MHRRFPRGRRSRFRCGQDVQRAVGGEASSRVGWTLPPVRTRRRSSSATLCTQEQETVHSGAQDFSVPASRSTSAVV